MKDSFHSAQLVAGQERTFRFSGSTFDLRTYESEGGRLSAVRLECRGASETFAKVLAHDSEIYSGMLQAGASCRSIIDGLAIHRHDQQYPVSNGGGVKSAATIWHAAFQILERNYSAGFERTPLPEMKNTTVPFLKVLDGGMA